MADQDYPFRSEWYRSRFFVCYTRVGIPPDRFREGHPGKFIICIANIKIMSEGSRGRGLFTHLVDRLAEGVEGLSYTRIDCEAVKNTRLRDWLGRYGFKPYESNEPTYYLDTKHPQI